MLPAAWWLFFSAVFFVSCKECSAQNAAGPPVLISGRSSNCEEPGKSLLPQPAASERTATSNTTPEEKEINSTDLRYVGALSPECVSSYYQMFVTRIVPPRNYLYHHEVDFSKLDLPKNPVPIQWRIVGGKEVSITSVPYQVLYGLYCGGSLIAPNWVITAAHCKNKERFVYAGSTKRSEAIRYSICAHFIHPRWGNEANQHPQDYDYQLVLLERPIPVTISSRPIAIGEVEDIAPRVMVFVSGWGYTRYKERHMQENLRRVSIPIIAHTVCAAMPNKNYQTISPRMFCAGYLNGTRDSCQGDSGGPVVVGGRLVGLVSFGVGCASPDHPGVYANVPIMREWIRSVTALPL